MTTTDTAKQWGSWVLDTQNNYLDMLGYYPNGGNYELPLDNIETFFDCVKWVRHLEGKGLHVDMTGFVEALTELYHLKKNPQHYSHLLYTERMSEIPNEEVAS
jgi:hypothetical protein